MSDTALINGKVSTAVLGVYRIIVTAAIGALMTWMFKLDDRIYELGKTVSTRADIVRIEDKIDRLQDRQHGRILKRPEMRP